MFVYSPFIPKHCITPSIHVHKLPRLAPAKESKNTAHFRSLSRSRARLKSPVTSVMSTQPCRWSNECPSRSVSPRPVCISLSHHTPLSLSLSAGGRAINNRQSASLLFTPSHLSFKFSRGVSVCDILRGANSQRSPSNSLQRHFRTEIPTKLLHVHNQPPIGENDPIRI